MTKMAERVISHKHEPEAAFLVTRFSWGFRIADICDEIEIDNEYVDELIQAIQEMRKDADDGTEDI